MDLIFADHIHYVLSIPDPFDSSWPAALFVYHGRGDALRKFGSHITEHYLQDLLAVEAVHPQLKTFLEEEKYDEAMTVWNKQAEYPVAACISQV